MPARIVANLCHALLQLSQGPALFKLGLPQRVEPLSVSAQLSSNRGGLVDLHVKPSGGCGYARRARVGVQFQRSKPYLRLTGASRMLT